MRVLFFVLLVARWILPCLQATVQGKTKLLLLAIDGLRWDHFGYDLPSLVKVGENGVKAKWLEPTYVTQSTPPFYTIATGLYTESHGVISNHFFETATQRIYSCEDTMNMTDWFDTGAEPIWVTAMKAGLRVGNIMYPGGNRPVKGFSPERVIAYSEYLWSLYSIRQRIDHAIQWLTEDDLDMVLVYFNEPDGYLHKYGIDHPVTNASIMETDETIGYLIQRLRETGIEDKTDLIILSDHGMTVQDPEKYICIHDYINPEHVEYVHAGHGPTVQVKPVEGKTEEVYQSLKEAHPVLNVYLKEDFPVRFHYGNNERNLPIIGYVDDGWIILTNCDPKIVAKTSHGCGHKMQDMQACFVAQGPSFKSGYSTGVIKAVDIYSLMCDILNLSPAPNNGTKSNYRGMLRSAPYSGSVALLAAVVLAVMVLNLWIFLYRSYVRTAESKSHDA